MVKEGRNFSVNHQSWTRTLFHPEFPLDKLLVESPVEGWYGDKQGTVDYNFIAMYGNYTFSKGIPQ